MKKTEPDYSAVTAARDRITALVRRTPVHQCELAGSTLFLKLENRQRTRSFKLRGALNAVSADERYRSGRFITASAGNHGMGAAAAALLLGGSATVVVSRDASIVKIKRINRIGGEIEIFGRDYDEAEEHARQRAEKEGIPFLHAFDDPLVIAGQGTVALEFLEQAPDIDCLVVPVGGGGLLSGCAVAARKCKPGIRVFGVQPSESPAMVRALAAGAVVETPIGDTVCDTLAGRFVSERTLAIAQACVDEVFTVSETSILAAMRYMQEQCGMIVEPSAVVGLAAIREGHLEGYERIGIIITGGNISRATHAALVARAESF